MLSLPVAFSYVWHIHLFRAMLSLHFAISYTWCIHPIRNRWSSPAHKGDDRAKVSSAAELIPTLFYMYPISSDAMSESDGILLHSPALA